MINEVNPSHRYQPLVQQKFPVAETLQTPETSFADTLKNFVGDVNDAQDASNKLAERFIKGENVDMHDVMIAGAKAKTSFQLLMELRTKGLDLYREVLRMQV